MMETVCEIWSDIVQWIHLHHVFGTVDFILVYFVIVLGYAAIMSIPVVGICLLIRTIWSKKRIGIRLLSWTLVLLIPFLGKLRLYYEVRPIAGMICRWQVLCSEKWFIKYIYLLVAILLCVYLSLRRRKLNRLIQYSEKREMFGESVYILPFETGAFSMGVIRPKIVISRSMLQNCTDEELKGIILHEKTHLKCGHIIMLSLWNVFRVLYWLNPFFHFGMGLLKEDIEYHCDMIVLAHKTIDPYGYGNLLLKQMQINNNRVKGDIAPLSEENGYETMRKRMIGISNYRDMGRGTKIALCILVVLFLVIGGYVLLEGSYPRFTTLQEVFVTSEQGEMLLSGKEADLKDVIDIHKDYIVVNKCALRKILPEERQNAEWVFLTFRGFTKLPGVGGSGEGVILENISKNETVRIPYTTVENDICVRIAKWI